MHFIAGISPYIRKNPFSESTTVGRLRAVDYSDVTPMHYVRDGCIRPTAFGNIVLTMHIAPKQKKNSLKIKPNFRVSCTSVRITYPANFVSGL